MNRPNAYKNRDHLLIAETVEGAARYELIVRDIIASLFEDKPAVSINAVNFKDGRHNEAQFGYDISIDVDRKGAPFSCHVEVSMGKTQEKWTDKKPERFKKDAEKNNTQFWPYGMNSEWRKEDNQFDIYFRISITGESWWAADWNWIRQNDILKAKKLNDSINRDFKNKKTETTGTDDLFGVIDWSWYEGTNGFLDDKGEDFIVTRMHRGVEVSTGRTRIVWFDKYGHKDGLENLKIMIRSILQDKMRSSKKSQKV